jgi:hypothetical protein
MQKEEFESIGATLRENSDKAMKGQEYQLLEPRNAMNYLWEVYYSNGAGDAGMQALAEIPAEDKIYLHQSIAADPVHASDQTLEMLHEALGMDKAFQQQRAAYEAEMEAKQAAFEKDPDGLALMEIAKHTWENPDKTPIEKGAALQTVVTAFSKFIGDKHAPEIRLFNGKPNEYGSYQHNDTGGVINMNAANPEFENFPKMFNTLFHEKRHGQDIAGAVNAAKARENDPYYLLNRAVEANLSSYIQGGGSDSRAHAAYERQYVEESANKAGARAEKFAAGIEALPEYKAKAKAVWSKFVAGVKSIPSIVTGAAKEGGGNRFNGICWLSASRCTSLTKNLSKIQKAQR